MATLIAKISTLASIGKGFLGSSGTQIGELLIDSTKFEKIQYSNIVTEHPVERPVGDTNQQVVTDYVYTKPIRYEFEGYVLDEPQTLLGSVTSVIDLFDGNPIENLKEKYKGKGKKQNTAYEILKSIARNKVLVDVVSYRDTFTNMIVEDVQIRDEADGYEGMFFSASLRQVEFVSVSTTTVTNAISTVTDLVSGKTKLGNQVPRALNAAQAIKGSSGLNNLIGGFF